MSAVAAVSKSVKKLGEIGDNLVSLIKNMDVVINVSTNLNSLKTISEGIYAVKQVNTALNVINNLNDSLATIRAVSAKTESIDVVATVADKINIISEALTDIQTVAQMKDTLTKVSHIEGFDNIQDISKLSTQVTKNTNDIETLTTTTIPELREQINSGSSADLTELTATVNGHTTKINKLESDVEALKTNSGTSSGSDSVDLTNYVTKDTFNTLKASVTKNTTDLTALATRVTTLEDSAGSGEDTPAVDLSEYAKKTEVDALKGDVTISAGENDIAGLDTRLKTLEDSSGSSTAYKGGWFPFHNPAGSGRSSGIRHEYHETENIEWTAPADCWVVVEGKGGGTESKDSSIYCTVSFGVDQHFCGNGTQSGANVYVYGSAFVPKGARLKITISNMSWVYLAHTAIYYDEGSRPASDTPTQA